MNRVVKLCVCVSVVVNYKSLFPHGTCSIQHTQQCTSAVTKPHKRVADNCYLLRTIASVRIYVTQEVQLFRTNLSSSVQHTLIQARHNHGCSTPKYNTLPLLSLSLSHTHTHLYLHWWQSWAIRKEGGDCAENEGKKTRSEEQSMTYVDTHKLKPCIKMYTLRTTFYLWRHT